MNKLISGYHNFQKNEYKKQKIQDLYHQGQKPEHMIVACADSRVDPAIIFDCNPGEIFTVRNVANIIPPYESDDGHHGTSAALEFGINHLKIKHLIILGHSECGGIHSCFDKHTHYDFIRKWMSIIDIDTKDKNEMAKNALHQSFRNALTFPWIKEKHDRGELQIHCMFFDILTCSLKVFNEEKKEYIDFEGES